MDLKETLMQDLKTAMREKDTVRKNTITLVRAAILGTEKDTKTQLDEEGVIDVITKQLKQRRDALADFERGGRSDLVELTNREIGVLLGYLPEQMGMEELEATVTEAVTRLGTAGMKDFKELMADITPRIKGRADAKLAADIARRIVSGK